MNIVSIIAKYRKPIINLVATIGGMIIANQITKIAKDKMMRSDEEPETTEVNETEVGEETEVPEESTDEETE